MTAPAVPVGQQVYWADKYFTKIGPPVERNEAYLELVFKGREAPDWQDPAKCNESPYRMKLDILTLVGPLTTLVGLYFVGKWWGRREQLPSSPEPFYPCRWHAGRLWGRLSAWVYAPYVRRHPGSALPPGGRFHDAHLPLGASDHSSPDGRRCLLGLPRWKARERRRPMIRPLSPYPQQGYGTRPAPGGRYVDKDMGGSFMQHYPSVAVMNARSFQPVLSGFGDAQSDADQAYADSRYAAEKRLHDCGSQAYKGLSQIAFLAAALILGPMAFSKGRSLARQR
jgi:hypothetical protein